MKVFRIHLAFLAALLSVSAPTFAQNADTLAYCPAFARLKGQTHLVSAPVSPRSRFYAGGDKSAPIDFSYEIEVIPKENPNIVDFYRLPEIVDSTWRELPVPVRLRMLHERIEARQKNDVVAVRTEGAPEFLSREMIRETRDSMRVELAKNNINESLDQTEAQLRWVFKNIGEASVQGQVAFRKGVANLDGAVNYIKSDYDIAQAEALERGYEGWTERGTIPARNLVHRSLGVPGAHTFDRMNDKIKAQTHTDGPDMETKYLYATTYRDDIYGPDKVGFEIRHCHKRLDCVLLRMRKLAVQIEDNFADYRSEGHDSRSFAVKPETLKGLESSVQELFATIDAHLNARHQGENIGGAPFKERLAFAYLDWANHPYVRALPGSRQAAFRDRLRIETGILTARLKNIQAEQISVEQKLDRTLVAISQWGHFVRLSEELKAGRDAFNEWQFMHREAS